MQNLNHIETFVLVVEIGSFTRAAKARGMSKAAVSKHVTELENAFGVALLTRSTRDVSLTEEGRFVYQECRHILDHVAEVEAMVSGLKEEPTGVLSVIAGPVFGKTYIIPYLAQFLAKYPKINLKINLRHLMPHMLEEKVDIVVGVFGAAPADAAQRTLFKTRRVLCASPSYLKTTSLPKRPKDLFQHPLLIHPDHPDDLEIRLKTDQEIRLIPRLISNDQWTIKTCVLDGMGIGYLQRHVIEEPLRQGLLVEILSDYLPNENTIPINLYYMKRRYLHSKVRCFIDFVLIQLQKSFSS